MDGQINLFGWKSDADRRRKKRRALDLTLALVAERVGISESTLHRYERGARRPSRAIAEAWTDALFKEQA